MAPVVMPARPATSARVTASKPFSRISSIAAWIRRARVRWRLSPFRARRPEAAGNSLITAKNGLAKKCNQVILYRTYITGECDGRAWWWFDVPGFPAHGRRFPVQHRADGGAAGHRQHL